jgi:hypothetical protein
MSRSIAAAGALLTVAARAGRPECGGADSPPTVGLAVAAAKSTQPESSRAPDTAGSLYGRSWSSPEHVHGTRATEWVLRRGYLHPAVSASFLPPFPGLWSLVEGARSRHSQTATVRTLVPRHFFCAVASDPPNGAAHDPRRARFSVLPSAKWPRPTM